MLNTMMFLHTYTHTYTQTLTPILPIDSVNEPIQTRALRLLFTLARHTKHTYGLLLFVWTSERCCWCVMPYYIFFYYISKIDGLENIVDIMWMKNKKNGKWNCDSNGMNMRLYKDNSGIHLDFECYARICAYLSSHKEEKHPWHHNQCRKHRHH